MKTKLLEAELCDPLRPRVFNIGVLYVKKGQTDEDQYFANKEGSPAFDQFLDFLGDRVKLAGWTGARGDLDVSTGPNNESTGVYSLYRRWKGFEIMFHVSTFMLYTEGAEQQVQRKRRIGNDIGTIIFQEGGVFTPPIRSQVLHCYYVVSPVESQDTSLRWKLNVSRRSGVPEFPPELPSPPVFSTSREARNFLFSKMLNGHMAAFRAPSLASKLWIRPKEAFMTDLVRENSKLKSVFHKKLDAATFMH